MAVSSVSLVLCSTVVLTVVGSSTLGSVAGWCRLVAGLVDRSADVVCRQGASVDATGASDVLCVVTGC